MGRNDIEVIQAAAGCRHGELKLYYIPSLTAKEMNGNGPENDWAKGQGSFSKSHVVYWIWQNTFRGELYRSKVSEWIDSICCQSVQLVKTSALLAGFDPSRTLVVIDTQGFELDVVLGLDCESMPRWVVIEQDTGSLSAESYLVSVGYRKLNSGHDVVFERNGRARSAGFVCVSGREVS